MSDAYLSPLNSDLYHCYRINKPICLYVDRSKANTCIDSVTLLKVPGAILLAAGAVSCKVNVIVLAEFRATYS